MLNSAEPGKSGKKAEGERPTQKDERMMKMAMKRKPPTFGTFDIRLSQSTCKILETETNANRLDLLAKKKKNPEGFSNQLALTMVG